MSDPRARIGCAVACGNVLGEGPVWDVSEASLYWVDIQAGLLQRYTPGSDHVDRWVLPERVSAVALREKGGFVLTLASGFATFDPETGTLERGPAPEAHLPGNRFNDAKCDAYGRFWAGTMDESATELRGALYRLDPDGSCFQIEPDFGIANGLAWSPDGRIFYCADSLQRTIFAYDFDTATGALANKRLFASMDHGTGAPDGACVDREGFLWSAVWNGSRLVRYAPDGRIDRIVRLPVSNPTSCAFGGSELRTLYVTSARLGLASGEIDAQSWAGHLLALDVGAQGMPAIRFAG